MAVSEKLREIRDLFSTKNIFNRSTVREFSDKMQLDIISAIQKNKKDGVYPICDRLQLALRNGRAIIQDKDNE